MSKPENPPPAPRHVWPWFVLAAFLLGVVAAFLWVRAEAQRLKRNTQFARDSQPETSVTPTAPASAKATTLGPWTNGMVWVPGGSFSMGAEDGQPDEKPIHQVTVDGFWMDKTEVTNEQFEKFARAT